MSPQTTPVAPQPTFAGPNRTGSIIPSDQSVTPLATPAISQNAVPASEPAILSSDGAAQRITNSQTKLAQLGQKGTTIDPGTGTALYADGSAVPAPQGAVYNEKTGQYEATDGKNYSVADFYGQNGNTADPDYIAIQNLFAPLKANLDANTLDQVNSIQQQYEALKTAQNSINNNAASARSQTLSLNGTSRYAPLDSAGIMHEQLSSGLMNIQNLDAKENAAIASAKSAQQSGDMDLMLKQIGQAETIRSQKQNTAASIQDAISKANEALTTQRATLAQNDAVANALSSGVTDPTKIAKALNDAGHSISVDDISKTLGNIASATGAAGVKGLTGDVGNFYTLKNTPGALPASILALPADQQLTAYIKMVNQAKQSASAGFTLGPNSVRYDANGNVIASGGGASSGNSNASSGGAPAQLSETGQAWVTAVLNGNATMQQVPAAIRDEVAVGLTNQPSAAYSPLASSRFTTAANRISSNFVNLPQYQLTANGLPYLQRIDAAMKTPGSVSDQDLLDSLTKLNTAGNAISDAQVKLITDGRSWVDSIGVAENKLRNGGVLSNNQRQQIQSIAKAIYENYQKGYQPVYDQVTKQLKAAGIPEAFWTMPNLNNLSSGLTGMAASVIPGHPDIGSSDTFDNFLGSAALPNTTGGNSTVNWSIAP